MKFRYINENSCPICGDMNIIKEEVETYNGEVNRHSNGGVWEKRTFSCGQRLEYIPNFSKTQLSEYAICTKNDEYKTKMANRATAIQRVLDFIDSLTDVDDYFKKQMKQGHFYMY